MKSTVALAALLLVLSGCGAAGPNPGDRGTQALTVSPPEGGTACPTGEISASFQLNDAMRKDGEVNRTVFTLTLDGKDVTPQADIRTTMEFPPSRADLVYRPAQPLSAGRHSASVSYPGAGGSKQRYTWSFTAQPSACQ